MRIKSRTWGWTAWLAYDRTVANRSLFSDYYQRPDEHPFATPVSGAVEISENTVWENLYSVRLGPPSISFEQSSLDSPRVTVSARALSGTQLSVEIVGGSPKQITRVAEYSPLLAPRLVSDAFLDDDDAANGAARVFVDLALAENHQFSFPGTRQQQRNGGAFFHERILELPDTSQRCALNLRSEWDDGLLVPDRLTVRPVPLLDESGEPTGDGAVVLMLAARGSEIGDLPTSDGDWKYPIPSGHHAALWLNNKCLLGQLMAGGVQAVSTDADFTYDDVGDPAVLTVSEGMLKPLQLEATVAPFGKLNCTVSAPLAGNPDAPGSLGISLVEGGVRLNWKTSTFGNVDAPLLGSQAPEGNTALDSMWRVDTTHELVRKDDGTLGLSLVGESRRWFKQVYRQGKALDPLHYQHFPAIEQGMTAALAREVEGVGVGMLGAKLGEVDQLQNRGIEFPDGTALAADSVHLPRDLAMFGDLSPPEGRFLLSPALGRVLVGGTLQLHAPPTPEAMEWTVESLEGFSGSPGTISPSGLYTAPGADSINGRFGLAKATATSGTHGASVWVAVLSDSLAISPLVFVAASTGARVRMSAGSLDEGEIEWSLTSATGATLEEAGVEDGTLAEPGDRVYIRGNGLTGAYFSVDEVTVRSSAGNERTMPVLVIEKDRRGTIRILDVPGLGEHQIQLDFDAGGAQPLPYVDWKIQIGGGSITPEGLCTLDPNSALPFVVITAEYEDQYAVIGNFILLPIPLVELNDVKRALA